MNMEFDLDDPGEAMPALVVAAFRKALPQEAAKLRTAFGGGDAAGMFRVAHDLKGQAPLFGYGLLAAVAAALVGLTRDRTILDVARLAAIEPHIGAIETIVNHDIKGGGGATGRALLAQLENRRAGL